MPKMIMLIGAPGSGKTTASNLFLEHDFAIHSSDAIREELFGDAAIQKDPQTVFMTLKYRLLKDLKNGKNVVFDATNTVRRERRKFLKNLPVHTEKIAVVFDTPKDECIRRNALRSRKVPQDVIETMCDRLKAFPPSLDDGFDKIVKIDEIDSIHPRAMEKI